VDQQRREELRALNYFLFLADRVGLPIPGDSQNLRLPDTVQASPQSFDRWPWPSILEVLAIAQHHGVPTRLLDFSHDPLIAAFFSAYFAWKDSQQMTQDVVSSKYFAVWAVDLNPIAALRSLLIWKLQFLMRHGDQGLKHPPNHKSSSCY